MAAYEELSESARDAFFTKLLEHYAADPDKVSRAIDAYRADPHPARLNDLHVAAESRRQELFRRLNTAPGGTRTLVQMRADLLKSIDDHPDRASVEADLLHLFRSWFNRGFLVMQRIDWRTSALILERLIQYEAVHQIQGWDDLRRRLEKDRRCYAFFHPALPDEPLIFIEAHPRLRAASPRSAVGRRGSRRRALRDLLLDHELPGGTSRSFVWQLPDQAGR